MKAATIIPTSRISEAMDTATRIFEITSMWLFWGDNTQHVIKVNRPLVADAATLQQPNKAEFENRKKQWTARTQFATASLYKIALLK